MERLQTYVTLTDFLLPWIGRSRVSAEETVKSLASSPPLAFPKRLLFFLEGSGFLGDGADRTTMMGGPFFQETVHQMKSVWGLSRENTFVYSCPSRDKGEGILRQLKAPSLFAPVPSLAILHQAQHLPHDFFLSLSEQASHLKKTVFLCHFDTYYKSLKSLYDTLCRRLKSSFLLIEAHYVKEEDIRKIVTHFAHAHGFALAPPALDFLIENLNAEDYPFIFRLLESLSVYALEGCSSPLTVQELQPFLPHYSSTTMYRYLDAFYSRQVPRCHRLKQEVVHHLQTLKRDVLLPLSFSFARLFRLYQLSQGVSASQLVEEAKKRRLYHPVLIKALPGVTFSFLEAAFQKINQMDFESVQTGGDDAQLAFLLLSQLELLWLSG